MRSPLQVGITGGIGSGKSIVTKIFSTLGISVYDADSRARLLMNTDLNLIQQIKSIFGDEAFADGRLNRKYLAEHVFGIPNQLEKLNSLVHPRVGIDYKQWVESQENSAYVLKEAALLFEAGTANQLDKIIVVTAPESLRIQRVMKRDGRREAEVKNILDRQWPEQKKVEKADFVITNDETTAVIPQVLKLHEMFLKIAKEHHQLAS